ncbi:uncharacterized protein LOC114521479 [Dendronephthya gigantea]|uniref:uncharacterized protein LOC114521479 n=1 Tax=Dendronephthya gigantea TaxID=151771 RepID=UPI00106CCD35|nr:uncharacterized protein LOC114521479 [Dendronephthya gigantea]
MGANNSRLPGRVYSYIRTLEKLTPVGSSIDSYNKTLEKPTPGHVYSYNRTLEKPTPVGSSIDSYNRTLEKPTPGSICSHIMTSYETRNFDGAIDDQDKHRLWAYNSGSAIEKYNSGSAIGKYVIITDKSPPDHNSTSYIVEATGDDEGENEDLTKITFLKADGKKHMYPPYWFQLQLEKKDQKYYLAASEKDVVAFVGAKDATLFRVIELFSPNEAFCVLQSNKKTEVEVEGTDEKKKKKKKKVYLYLSSDRVGNLKLKIWNEPAPYPPHTSAHVDPALLFRVVRPCNLKTI